MLYELTSSIGLTNIAVGFVSTVISQLLLRILTSTFFCADLLPLFTTTVKVYLNPKAKMY